MVLKGSIFHCNCVRTLCLSEKHEEVGHLCPNDWGGLVGEYKEERLLRSIPSSLEEPFQRCLLGSVVDCLLASNKTKQLSGEGGQNFN